MSGTKDKKEKSDFAFKVARTQNANENTIVLKAQEGKRLRNRIDHTADENATKREASRTLEAFFHMIDTNDMNSFEGKAFFAFNDLKEGGSLNDLKTVTKQVIEALDCPNNPKRAHYAQIIAKFKNMQSFFDTLPKDDAQLNVDAAV